MKRVKPGRGPSAMGAFASIIISIFGVFWTVGAAAIGAPFFFPLFGVLFVLMGIGNAVYNWKNATSQNRYSSFDIVDDHEEPDPLNQRFGTDFQPETRDIPSTDGGFRFCPYCGASLGDGFAFCSKCGRELPDSE